MNRVIKVFMLIHIVLWILLSLLVALQLESGGDSNWLVLTAGFILTSLYVFYTHFFLLTRYLGKRMKGAYFLRLAGIIMSAPFLFMFFKGSMLPALITIVPIFLFLSWLARVIQNLIINTIKKEQLEKQAVEAELYYLKSQINPHFLFNTLNNIHTLVYKQAPAAPEAVIRLSSLMRYMIYESNALTVPFSREINYLHDYISLQQLRYNKSPIVDLEIEGDIGSFYIAPLLFIHLLENAYKHTPARLEPGDVKMRVEIKENTLTFSIQNPIGKNQGNKLEETGGIGLPNVRKRLTLLYPGQHNLEINSSGEIFTVTLKIHDLHLQAHERKDYLLYN